MKFMQITDENAKLIALFPSEGRCETWERILFDIDYLFKEYRVMEVERDVQKK
jgi:hypothetical protein